jgi:hypothetical protein
MRLKKSNQPKATPERRRRGIFEKFAPKSQNPRPLPMTRSTAPLDADAKVLGEKGQPMTARK